MKTQMKILFFLVVFLSGCAQLNIKPGKVLSESTNKGVLAVGLTAENDIPNFYWKLRKIGTNQSKDLTFYTLYDPLIWSDPRGRLVVIELDEGNYEFYDWTIALGLTPTSYFSIPFTIEKGKVTYQGRLHLKADKKSMIYAISVSDHILEDKKIISNYIINLDEKNITKQLATIHKCSDFECVKPKKQDNSYFIYPIFIPSTR